MLYYTEVPVMLYCVHKISANSVSCDVCRQTLSLSLSLCLSLSVSLSLSLSLLVIYTSSKYWFTVRSRDITPPPLLCHKLQHHTFKISLHKLCFALFYQYYWIVFVFGGNCLKRYRNFTRSTDIYSNIWLFFNRLLAFTTLYCYLQWLVHSHL